MLLSLISEASDYHYTGFPLAVYLAICEDTLSFRETKRIRLPPDPSFDLHLQHCRGDQPVVLGNPETLCGSVKEPAELPCPVLRHCGEVEQRDAQDRNREIAPAVAAPDAIHFDNSYEGFDEALSALLSVIHHVLEEQK